MQTQRESVYISSNSGKTVVHLFMNVNREANYCSPPERFGAGNGHELSYKGMFFSLNILFLFLIHESYLIVSPTSV